MKYFNSLSFDMKTSLLCVKGMINIEVLSKTNWQGYDLLFITSRDDLLSITSVSSFHHIASSESLCVNTALSPAPDWALSVGAGSGPHCDKQPPYTLDNNHKPKKLQGSTDK